MNTYAQARRSMARQRGSLLVMVMAVLMLMLVMGMAYLEVTRQDSRATTLTTRANADAVLRDVTGLIKQKLLDDVAKTSGGSITSMFDENAGIEPYDYPYTNPDTSNPSNLRQVRLSDTSVVQTLGGWNDDTWLASTSPDFNDPSNPGNLDPSGYARWRHITNLTGVFIELPTRFANDNMRVPSPTATNANNTRISMEYTTTATRNTNDEPTTDAEYRHSDTMLIIGNTNTHYNFKNYLTSSSSTSNPKYMLNGPNPDDMVGNNNRHELEPIGVDADGDGIPDSRWTWAPRRIIGDVAWVMAVRIIDNSSLFNVNVASVLTDHNGAFAAGHEPRWWYPSELDMGSFMRSLGGSGSDDFENLLAFFRNYRQPGVSTIPIGWGSNTNERGFNFAPNATTTNHLYGNYLLPTQSNIRNLLIDNELELRHRNGLNDPGTVTVMELPSAKKATSGPDDANSPGLDRLMRSYTNSATMAERHYRNVLATNSTAAGSTLPAFTNSNATSTNDMQQMRHYFQRNPRALMTVASGAAIYATTYPSENDRQLKRPINDFKTKAGLDRSANIIQAILNQGTIPFTVPTSFADRNEYADRFVVAVKDYADDDNKLTVYNGFTGMEALPFIAEAYSQRQYNCTAATQDPMNPTNWTGITWTAAGEAGYAIELRNPFRRKVSLENVHLFVGGNDWGDLKTLAGVNDMDVAQTIVLFKNSGGSESKNDIENEVITGASPNPPVKKAISNAWPVGTGNVNVELRVKAVDADGAAATDVVLCRYQAKQMPDSYGQANLTSVSNPTSPALKAWRQSGSVGNGKGLNVIIVQPVGAGTNAAAFWEEDGNSNPPKAWDGSKIELGEEDKTGGGGPADVFNKTGQPPQQLLISDIGRVVHIGELAQVCILGASTSGASGKVVAEVLGNETNLDNLRLNFASTELVKSLAGTPPEPYPSHAVPHAVHILQRFTTIMPTEFPIGAGNADAPSLYYGQLDAPQGALIPGTINLNTISGDLSSITPEKDHLLQRILPISDTNVRNSVIKGIIKYRDKIAPYDNRDTSTGITGFRKDRGIAHLGELLMIADKANVPTGSIDESSSMWHRLDLLAHDSLDNDALPAGGTTIDFTPGDGKTPADVIAADGIKDDVEERVMVAKWLSQVCNVRSDIFTAYILLRGYPADDFRKGPIEQKRYIVVFDRSGIVKGTTDEIRILGMREY